VLFGEYVFVESTAFPLLLPLAIVLVVPVAEAEVGFFPPNVKPEAISLPCWNGAELGRIVSGAS